LIFLTIFHVDDLHRSGDWWITARRVVPPLLVMVIARSAARLSQGCNAIAAIGVPGR
jgi:hypothetical protein